MALFHAALAAGLTGLALLAVPGVRRHGHRHVHARFVPEPISVLSFLALFGAFGNLLAEAAGAGIVLAAALSLVAAAAFEALVVRRLYKLALGFEGRPSTPLESLIADEVRAVSAFRNGRGIVEAVHDGRAIQLAARLPDDERAFEVRNGERLTIVGVDPDEPRVTVSVVRVSS